MKWIIAIALLIVAWYSWRRSQPARTMSYDSFAKAQGTGLIGDFDTNFWQNMFRGSAVGTEVLGVRGPIDAIYPSTGVMLT